MDPDREAAENEIARELLATGWRQRGALSPALLKYANQRAEIYLQPLFDEAGMLVEVFGQEGAGAQRGQVYYEDQLPRFLALLKEWQDQLSQENFTVLLRQFAAAGMDTYRLAGDTAIPVEPGG